LSYDNDDASYIDAACGAKRYNHMFVAAALVILVSQRTSRTLYARF